MITGTKSETQTASSDDPDIVPKSTGRGRLLVVTSNLPRWEGDSTTPFILTLAKGLVSLGWDIDILAPHAPGARTRETLSGVRVYRFRYMWPERLQTVCYGGGALVNLRNRPAEILKLPALVFAEMFAIMWMHWRNPYDAIHAHWIVPQGFVCAVVSRLFRIPLVVSCHGSDLTALRGRFVTRFKKIALQKAQIVTTNSELVTGLVTQIAPGLKKIEQIPMPSEATVEPDQNRVSEIRAQYRSEGQLLVTVARLVIEKGVDDFLRAVALLDRPGIHAVIVGDGQDSAALKKLAAELGLTDQVSFVGWSAPKDVAAYLHAADVFVGLSKSNAKGGGEGFGLTFLEAMHAARPVVATRSGAIDELVQDNITGHLVPESAPQKAAAAIGRLLDDPKLAEAMGLAGKQWLGDRFTEEAAAQRFDLVFRDLIDSGKGPTRS